MGQINIVLVSPEIPQNTGNIARTCAATGAFLHLVRPLGFEIDDKKMKRAGLDYWDKLDVTFYDSLDDFLRKTDGCERWFFSTKAPRDYTQAAYGEEPWIVFGCETRGLPESLLAQHPDACVRIPMRPTLRSLNLSNAVAVGTYEVLRQRSFSALQCEGDLTQYHWADVGNRQM